MNDPDAHLKRHTDLDGAARLRSTASAAAEMIINGAAVLGGCIVGIWFGGAVLFACLAFGPLGWLAAFFLVPLAFAFGGALGGVGGIVALLIGGGFLLLWLLPHA